MWCRGGGTQPPSFLKIVHRLPGVIQGSHLPYHPRGPPGGKWRWCIAGQNSKDQPSQKRQTVGGLQPPRGCLNLDWDTSWHYRGQVLKQKTLGKRTVDCRDKFYLVVFHYLCYFLFLHSFLTVFVFNFVPVISLFFILFYLCFLIFIIFQFLFQVKFKSQIFLFPTLTAFCLHPSLSYFCFELYFSLSMPCLYSSLYFSSLHSLQTIFFPLPTSHSVSISYNTLILI